MQAVYQTYGFEAKHVTYERKIEPAGARVASRCAVAAAAPGRAWDSSAARAAGRKPSVVALSQSAQ